MSFHAVLFLMLAIFPLASQASPWNQPEDVELEAVQVVASVKFDCYLPDGAVECQTLKQSFFSTMRFFREDSTDAADIVLEVRKTDFPEKTVYSVKHVGKGTLPVFTPVEEIPNSLSADAKFNRVLSLCQFSVLPDLKILSPGTTKNGVFTAQMGARDGATGGAGKSSVPWYVNPTINVQITKSEILDVTGSGSLTFNYSADSWRMQGGGNASYHKIVIPMGAAGEMKGEIFSYGARSVISYSLAGKWSVAALFKVDHKPQANMQGSYEAAAGVEWDLVPFMEHNERNVSVRYTIGALHDDYIVESERGRLHDDYFLHSLNVYFVWHFSRMDVNVQVGGFSVVADPRYSGMVGAVDFTMRVTDNFYVVPFFVTTYTNDYQNRPAAGAVTNPLQSYLMGGQFSPFFYVTGVALKFYFGAPRPDDQRWKNAAAADQH